MWIDTFADVDRGYFPRTGLVDRRHNPRLAGRVCRALNAVLGDAPAVSFAGMTACEGGRLLQLEHATDRWLLLLPDPEIDTANLPFAAESWIDLSTGTVGRERPSRCRSPWLLAGVAADGNVEAPRRRKRDLRIA